MAAGVALGATARSAVGPALLASRDRLHDDLRRSGRAGLLGGQGRFFRSALVVSQVAVALVVLAAAYSWSGARATPRR
ncbi:MAG: hypothetical protein R2882_01090 [Gemmatimonadales bacterium]